MGCLLAATSTFARGAASQGTSNNTVRYRSTDGTFVTISETEQRSRIADIQGLMNGVDAGRDVLFSTGEKTIVLDAPRLDKIALWLVANGGLTPGQMGNWKTEQIEASKQAAENLRAELAALRGATTIATSTTTAAEPASGDPLAVSFPDPMDWRGARGMIIGTYFLDCGEWSGGTYTAGPNEEAGGPSSSRATAPCAQGSSRHCRPTPYLTPTGWREATRSGSPEASIARGVSGTPEGGGRFAEVSFAGPSR